MASLFSPCTLGPFALRNPLVFLPFHSAYAEAEGLVGPQVLAHYRRMAATGVGLVVVESTKIRAAILPRVGLRAFEPAHLPGLTALAEAIHGEGAKAVVQINYLSRYSGQPGALAPSAVPAFGNPELMPREMTAEDMAVMADAFAESADIVRQAGFDGVELHGATGYLLSSFTSPRTNLRTDEYGGSVENRMRFPLQVFDTVRRKVGDFPIGYRFMAREYLDWGLSLEDGVACARLLAVKKPAYLSVSAGTHECFAMYGKKKKFPVGFMLPEAAAVKKALPDTAVIAAGRLETREICEQALDQGMADGIGLGRVLFCDPQWLHKISGENPEAVRGCVQCQTCQKKIMEGKPVECSRWTKEEKALYLRNVAAS